MAKTSITRRSFVKMSTTIAGAVAAGGLLTACSSGNEDAEQASTTGANEQQAQGTDSTGSSASDSASASNNASSSKILVAYYSAQGHTKRVAEAAADELDADLFEIVPNEVYSDDDLNWTNEQSRVTQEYENESLRDVPLTQTAPDNWADYDTVLIGYPIWGFIGGRSPLPSRARRV